MKISEARQIIWSRLATTAREDGRNVDWFQEGYSEADANRLEKASVQVAETIVRRLLRK